MPTTVPAADLGAATRAVEVATGVVATATHHLARAGAATPAGWADPQAVAYALAQAAPGLGELGTFGLSVPEEYGGYSAGGEGEYLAMVVATEELARGSLGAAGSLITRPEILTRALVKGGTEAQKRTWLPKLATGEIMN